VTLPRLESLINEDMITRN